MGRSRSRPHSHRAGSLERRSGKLAWRVGAIGGGAAQTRMSSMAVPGRGPPRSISRVGSRFAPRRQFQRRPARPREEDPSRAPTRRGADSKDVVGGVKRGSAARGEGGLLPSRGVLEGCRRPGPPTPGTEVPTYSRARGQGRIGPRGRADVGGAIVLRVKRLSDGAEETLHGSRRDDLGRRESARALPKCNGNLAKKRIQKNLTRLRRGRGQLYLVGVLTLSRSQWGMAGHEIHAWGSPRRVLSRGSEVSEVGGAKRRACSGHLHNLAANGRVSHPLAALFFGG